MKPLEDELRRALQRRDPPGGFAERMMARVEQQAGARGSEGVKPRWRWAPWVLWTGFGRRVPIALAAVAAALALTVSISVWREHRIQEQRREGEAARAQVLEALRITSVKLNRVRERVRAATEDGDHVRDAESSQD